MLGVTIKHNSSLLLIIWSFPCYFRLHLTLWNLSLAHWSICPSRRTACKHGGNNSTEFALKRQLLPFCQCLPGQREHRLLQSLITLHNIDNINDVTVHWLYSLFESLLCYLALFNSHGRSGFRFA